MEYLFKSKIGLFVIGQQITNKSQYLSMMNYLDHHLKRKYDERIENEDVAEAHGIRYFRYS